MTRNSVLVIGGLAVVAIGLAGWGAAAAIRPVHVRASDGRVLQVRYEVRREPAYAPPPPAEATRLDVLNPQSAVVIEDGVLSAQAGQALRSLQAEDDARTAAALGAVRAQDARIDRDTAAALSSVRQDGSAEAAEAQASSPA